MIIKEGRPNIINISTFSVAQCLKYSIDFRILNNNHVTNIKRMLAVYINNRVLRTDELGLYTYVVYKKLLFRENPLPADQEILNIFYFEFNIPKRCMMDLTHFNGKFLL